MEQLLNDDAKRLQSLQHLPPKLQMVWAAVCFWEFNPLNRNAWKRIFFVLLHVWIIFHFFAVIVAPASVPPAAPVAQNAWNYVGGYLQLIFMNHGYHFFAPEPAGSALIEYEATKPDGTRLWNRIPNRDIWPRLNYHRHFMLTEHMAAEINMRPELEPLLCQTYADEIARQTGADRVVLFQVEHDLSTVEQVRAGRRLDDPVTFSRRRAGEYSYQISEEDSESTVPTNGTLHASRGK